MRNCGGVVIVLVLLSGVLIIGIVFPFGDFLRFNAFCADANSALLSAKTTHSGVNNSKSDNQSAYVPNLSSKADNSGMNNSKSDDRSPLFAGMSGACTAALGFRTPIFKPSTMANSTLERKCSGGCVAFCFIGLIETFFDERVHLSMAKYLVNGFGDKGRNDVFFAVSDEYHRWPFGGTGLPKAAKDVQWADKGIPFPLPAKKDQCIAWHKFPVVGFIAVPAGAGYPGKGLLCRNNLERVEAMHRRKYDWVVRGRMDFVWYSMPFNTKIRNKCIFYDDQFKLWARSAMPDSGFFGVEPFRCDAFTEPFPFRSWRGNEAVTLKLQYYMELHLWFLRTLWPEIDYAQKNWKDAAQIRRAAEKWHRCASLVMAFACDRYRQFDLRYEPKLPWEGLMHDPARVTGAGMKMDQKIPDGDFFRMLMRDIAKTSISTDLKATLYSASVLLDIIDIDKVDTRSLRMHFLDYACDKPCEDGPYSINLNQTAWRPQCLTEKLRNSIWYRATGMEYGSGDLWGLC